MRLWAGRPRYLENLASLLRATEALHAERVIATARVVLAVSGLIAVYLDPTQPARFAAVACILLLVYAAHSVAVLVYLRIRSESRPSVGWTLHAIDLVWACSITLFTEGPSSPFFVFFVFLLVASSYRWGLRPTLVTTVIAISLLVVQAVVVTSQVDSLDGLKAGEFELNRVVIRAAYLALIGFLVGYLAEAERKLRAETAFVSRLLGKVRAEFHFRGSLQFLFRELLELFESERALLVTIETRTDRAFAWQARRDGDEGIVLESFELDSAGRERYFFPFPAQAWVSRGLDGLGLDGDGRHVPAVSGEMAASLARRYGVQSLVAVTCGANNEWSGRLFLFEPALDHRDEEALRFLQRVLNQLAPAVHNVYLLRRLRFQAGAIERARVARELHDGVIQVLISIEMQIEVLRSQAAGKWTELGDEISRLQGLLRQTVIQVRELMQEIKPLDLEPREFVDFLASSVEKFERDTGIVARFHSELDEVRLRPRVAHEVARIVQEALVNVRKHSRAQNVLVRLGAEDGSWKLVVDDDGRGFDFSGRVNSTDLDSTRRGPIIMKERIRSIGGELIIESGPGKGSRLEITFPRQTGIEP